MGGWTMMMMGRRDVEEKGAAGCPFNVDESNSNPVAARSDVNE